MLVRNDTGDLISRLDSLNPYFPRTTRNRYVIGDGTGALALLAHIGRDCAKCRHDLPITWEQASTDCASKFTPSWGDDKWSMNVEMLREPSNTSLIAKNSELSYSEEGCGSSGFAR